MNRAKDSPLPDSDPRIFTGDGVKGDNGMAFRTSDVVGPTT
jgi:hypothetical protein